MTNFFRCFSLKCNRPLLHSLHCQYDGQSRLRTLHDQHTKVHYFLFPFLLERWREVEEKKHARPHSQTNGVCILNFKSLGFRVNCDSFAVCTLSPTQRCNLTRLYVQTTDLCCLLWNRHNTQHLFHSMYINICIYITLNGLNHPSV